VKVKWWAVQDSNLRPPACKAELTPIASGTSPVSSPQIPVDVLAATVINLSPEDKLRLISELLKRQNEDQQV